jgi:hypothetical protein
MDTNVKELKQGASKIADLLQRKLQEEVLEPKPSTASSDEEKLAACISKTRLQAQRLSGAQRKKLIKERKMNEGTWPKKTPYRKNPPSQDKGKAGSSGGVKRPHSDSSTPSQENQQPKKPRCRLQHRRKLLLESRRQLSTGYILMFTWTRPRWT